MKALKRLGMLPWIAAIAMFMQTLDATILNTALPAIAHSLNHSPIAMQGTIISYTLTIAILIPVSGWLADRYGTQRVFIFSVVLFTLGSICCGLSQSLNQLIIARVIQAIGGAMMMPVARLALLRAFSRDQLLPVLNFVTIPGLIGPVVGPLLGGLLVTYLSWHWIFLINIPVGIIGIYFAKRHMPNYTLEKRPLDLTGFLLFSGSLALVTGAIEGFDQQGLPTLLLGLVLLCGLVLIYLYIRHAQHRVEPFISLDLFKIRTYSIGLLGNVLSRLGVGCVPFLVPLMLQVGFNYSPMIAGFTMVPTALGFIVAKSTVTSVLRKFGYRNTLTLVTLLIGIMIALFYFQHATTPIMLLCIPLFILGILMSTQFTAINTLSLGYLKGELTSAGNSVLAVAMQLSITLGVSISAIILRFYHREFTADSVSSFHYTFVTMGLITLFSSLVFSRLKKQDGADLIPKHN